MIANISGEIISILCFSESSFNYEANHQDLYIGVCGVNKNLWNDYLEQRGIHYNSLKAGLEVYKFYLKVNNGNKKNAILEFKGVQKSKKVRDIVDKILVIEKELNDI